MLSTRRENRGLLRHCETSRMFAASSSVHLLCMVALGSLTITVLYCTVLYCTVLYCTALYCTVLYCTVLHCTCRGWAPPRGGAALAAPAPPPPGLWCSSQPSCSLAHGRLIATSFYAISFYIYLCLVGTFNKEKALVVVVVGAFSEPCETSRRHLSFL